jgi:hypothetical protein
LKFQGIVFAADLLNTVLLSPSRLSPGDPSSYSLPEECRIIHTHLEINVDFREEVISGFAEVTLRRINETITRLVRTHTINQESVSVCSRTQILVFLQEGYEPWGIINQ